MSVRPVDVKQIYVGNLTSKVPLFHMFNETLDLNPEAIDDLQAGRLMVWFPDTDDRVRLEVKIEPLSLEDEIPPFKLMGMTIDETLGHMSALKVAGSEVFLAHCNRRFFSSFGNIQDRLLLDIEGMHRISSYALVTSHTILFAIPKQCADEKEIAFKELKTALNNLVNEAS